MVTLNTLTGNEVWHGFRLEMGWTHKLLPQMPSGNLGRNKLQKHNPTAQLALFIILHSCASTWTSMILIQQILVRYFLDTRHCAGYWEFDTAQDDQKLFRLIIPTLSSVLSVPLTSLTILPALLFYLTSLTCLLAHKRHVT